MYSCVAPAQPPCTSSLGSLWLGAVLLFDGPGLQQGGPAVAAWLPPAHSLPAPMGCPPTLPSPPCLPCTAAGVERNAKIGDDEEARRKDIPIVQVQRAGCSGVVTDSSAHVVPGAG